MVEHPEVAGVRHEARAAVVQRRSEAARDCDRHLGIRLAMPEPHRHADLAERYLPRPAEQSQLLDGAAGPMAQSFSGIVEQRATRREPGVPWKNSSGAPPRSPYSA